MNTVLDRVREGKRVDLYDVRDYLGYIADMVNDVILEYEELEKEKEEVEKQLSDLQNMFDDLEVENKDLNAMVDEMEDKLSEVE